MGQYNRIADSIMQLDTYQFLKYHCLCELFLSFRTEEHGEIALKKVENITTKSAVTLQRYFKMLDSRLVPTLYLKKQ